MEERSITVKSILSQCQYPKHGEAAAFQENLQDVKVTFGLQSRIKEQKDPDGNTVTPAGAWTEVPERAVTGRFQCGQCHQKRKQNHAEI